MNTILIKVYVGYARKFTATLEAWDLGMVWGDGDSIPEAIEDFLDNYEAKFNVRPEYRWI